jgi:hypothetical protein
MARLFGIEPELYWEDAIPHWDSRFKRENHPNRYVNGVDTKTGLPIFSNNYLYQGY